MHRYVTIVTIEEIMNLRGNGGSIGRVGGVRKSGGHSINIIFMY